VTTCLENVIRPSGSLPDCPSIIRNDAYTAQVIRRYLSGVGSARAFTWTVGLRSGKAAVVRPSSSVGDGLPL
jgi:hypothetical protein